MTEEKELTPLEILQQLGLKPEEIELNMKNIELAQLSGDLGAIDQILLEAWDSAAGVTDAPTPPVASESGMDPDLLEQYQGMLEPSITEIRDHAKQVQSEAKIQNIQDQLAAGVTIAEINDKKEGD